MNAAPKAGEKGDPEPVISAPGQREGGATGASEEPSDAVLARRVQRGDRQAFALLARRYLRPIHTVVTSYLSNRADIEDAAQEAFLRALDGIDTFDPERPFAPWLYQIARNVARNRRRRQGRWRTRSLEDIDRQMVSEDPGPDIAPERAELRGILAGAIEELPEQQRTAFTLSDIEGYRATEIAGLMGLSPGTVRSHVHHARRALRERLRPYVRGENDMSDENHDR